jgi:type I restriction-modification system DNA methylase subunit
MSLGDIVNKLWNYCNVLRDDGMSYGDYVEQLTYLLFLKMADERSKMPYNQKSTVGQVSSRKMATSFSITIATPLRRWATRKVCSD